MRLSVASAQPAVAGCFADRSADRLAVRRAGVGPSRRRGATLADVCVLVFLAVVMFGAVLPQLGATQRENADRVKCAANLRAIATHAFIYSNQDIRSGGKFPRLYFDRQKVEPAVLYSGLGGPASFGPNGAPQGGPAANDVTGAFYLLMKNTDLTAGMFVCPSGDAKGLAKGVDVQERSNFTGRAELSYSYNNPYPTMAAISGGWRFDQTLGPDFPLAADMNFGDTDAGGPTKVAYDADRKLMATANSANHQFAGQNVAYCDVHVEWQSTPFCGPKRTDKAYRDNIYAAEVKVDATGKGGVVLGAAQDAYDAVLLPTYADGPQPKDPPARKPTAQSIADAPAAAPASRPAR